MYKISSAPKQHTDFDLIVIGSGPAGSVVAHNVATAGKRVALIEAARVGGDSPHHACIPTKALLEAAKHYRTSKSSQQFGVDGKGVSLTQTALQQWKQAAINDTGITNSESFLSGAGVKLYKGHAWFIDPHTVSIEGRRFRAQYFLVATGAAAYIPDIAGLENVDYLTYHTAVAFEKLPKSIGIIGGGPAGLEFAEIYSSFGAKVHVFEQADRLLPKEDWAVGDVLRKSLSSRGIHVYTESPVTRITKAAGKKSLHYEARDGHHKVTVDTILVATGKQARTDIGLDNASVHYDEHGIHTSATLQTSASHIYAAGDVVGPHRHTHVATHQARIAAHNILHRQKRQIDYRAVPRCVFIDPEVACVGETESELNRNHRKYQVGHADIAQTSRASTTGKRDGFVRIITTPKGLIIGASIVSPQATEMVHELSLAIQHRLHTRDIVNTMHAFPTYSEAVHLAAQKLR